MRACENLGARRRAIVLSLRQFGDVAVGTARLQLAK
jgi:hypothetical protein